MPISLFFFILINKLFITNKYLLISLSPISNYGFSDITASCILSQVFFLFYCNSTSTSTINLQSQFYEFFRLFIIFYCEYFSDLLHSLLHKTFENNDEFVDRHDIGRQFLISFEMHFLSITIAPLNGQNFQQVVDMSFILLNKFSTAKLVFFFSWFHHFASQSIDSANFSFFRYWTIFFISQQVFF